jgi:hypothetical protein
LSILAQIRQPKKSGLFFSIFNLPIPYLNRNVLLQDHQRQINAVSVVAIAVLFSSLPKELGMYLWFASRNPKFIGSISAYHDSILWGYMFEELYKNDQRGQKIVVTGANSGIGYEISLALAQLKANATLACWNVSRCDKLAQLR